MFIGLNVKYPVFLSDLNETGIFSTDQFSPSLKKERSITWSQAGTKNHTCNKMKYYVESSRNEESYMQ